MTSSMGSGRSSLIYIFFDVCSCSRLPRRGRYSIGGAHWPQHTNRFRLIVHPAAEQIAVVSQSKAQAMMMMMKKPKRSIEKQSKAIFPQFQFLLRKSSWSLLILRARIFGPMLRAHLRLAAAQSPPLYLNSQHSLVLLLLFFLLLQFVICCQINFLSSLARFPALSTGPKSWVKFFTNKRRLAICDMYSMRWTGGDWRGAIYRLRWEEAKQRENKCFHSAFAVKRVRKTASKNGQKSLWI